MNFDLVARHFRWMESLVFGEAMQRARTEFLSRIAPVRHALLLGEGDGRFLQALLQRHPAMMIDCVDSSRQMLELAKSRMGKDMESERIKFIQADIRSAELPSGRYDLVATNFFFDCFNRRSIENIAAKIGQAAAARAHWLLADFQNEARPLRDRFLLRVMYSFFRCTCRLEARELVPACPFLESAGFSCEARSYQWSGFIKSEFWRR